MGRRLLPILAACLLAVAAASAGEPTTVADFERGDDRFKGESEHDPTVGADGSRGSLKLSQDFGQTKRKWVSTGRYLRVRHQRLASFSLKIRSTTRGGFNLQLKDATGQVHQHRLTFPKDGEWHTITLTDFASEDKWGGMDDGKFHWPARAVYLILEGDKDAGPLTLWFDDVQVQIAE